MKAVLCALMLTIASGTAAIAGTPHAPDLDYINAKRCLGLAQGLGASGEAARLKAYVDYQGRIRMPVVSDMGDDELRRAKHETRNADARERLAAELDARCAAYVPPEATASR